MLRRSIFHRNTVSFVSFLFFASSGLDYSLLKYVTILYHKSRMNNENSVVIIADDKGKKGMRGVRRRCTRTSGLVGFQDSIYESNKHETWPGNHF